MLRNQYSIIYPWSLEEDQIIKNNYKNLERSLLENLLFGRTWKAIQKRASIMGIQKVEYPTRCNLNRNFFSELNNKSAYLLGVLEAEGCISKNKVNLTLGGADKQWMENLKSICSSTSLITKKSGGSFPSRWPYRYSTSFSSKEWIKDLDRLNFRTGLLPTKDSSLIRYYLRGYFDGDGTIFWDKYNAHFSSAFYGHPISLIQKIQDIMAENGINFGYTRSNLTCFITKGGRLATLDLAKYFPYEHYMLERKTKLLYMCKKINLMKKKNRISVYSKIQLDGIEQSVHED